MGMEKIIEHVKRFGFDQERLPKNLSIALGTASISPLELASGYAILANGGFRVDPYFIERAEDADGNVFAQANARRVCLDCESRLQPTEVETDLETPTQPGGSPDINADANGPKQTDDSPRSEADGDRASVEPAPRVISARNIWLMNSLMRDVIKRGTGRRALQLGRKDLAGKTGTTNDQRDAWFSGFNPSIITTVWVGFDRLEPLGRRETGARAALPVWIDYMREALLDRSEEFLDQPEGLVTVRIDPNSGRLANADDEAAIFETFYSERVPESLAEVTTPTADSSAGVTQGVTEKLF
jgi:penicillin-binding protein 1A